MVTRHPRCETCKQAQSFFVLAGAVELHKSVNAKFGVDLPATATFDYPTAAALAAFIAAGSAPAVQVIVDDGGMKTASILEYNDL